MCKTINLVFGDTELYKQKKKKKTCDQCKNRVTYKIWQDISLELKNFNLKKKI